MLLVEPCRMQKWESQAGSTSCMRPGARFHSLQHKVDGAQQQGNDYLVSLAEYQPPAQHDWRVLRLVGTGPQQDGVHRLDLAPHHHSMHFVGCTYISSRS